MKQTLTFTLLFSFCLFFSQAKKDSLKISKNKYSPNLTVGVDLLNGALAFGDRKLFQVGFSSKIKKTLNASLDLGYDKNIYQKSGYDASAKGIFAKIGGYYMLSVDKESKDSGFYAGGKVAASFYKQQYYAVPIRAYGTADQYLQLPASQQSAYWVEGVIGARVQLFTSRFYIDVNVQPRIMAYTTKQETMQPMIIPGFGQSSSRLNMGFSWNLAYRF